MGEKRHTPFVIGVFANLSGDPVEPLPRLRDRRFVRVQNQSLTQLFRSRRPSAKYHFPNRGDSDPKQQHLVFENMEALSRTALTQEVAKATGESLTQSEPLFNQMSKTSEVKELFATWTGVSLLVDELCDCPEVVIKVLDVNKQDVQKDLERASEFDQSATFKKVYDEGLGSFGGDLFGCLALDYEITNHPADISLLQQLMYIAAASGAPLLVGVNPQFLQLQTWSELNPNFAAAWTSAAPDYARWAALRQSEDASFLYLFGPRVHWIPLAKARNEWSYNSRITEQCAETERATWINPVYFVAAAIGHAFASDQPDQINAALFGETKEERIPRDESTAAPTNGLRTVTFSWNAPEISQDELRELGLNILSKRRNTCSSLLREFVSAHLKAENRFDGDLPQTLYSMHAAHRLRRHLRDKIGSLSPALIFQEAQNWLKAYAGHGTNTPKLVVRRDYRYSDEAPLVVRVRSESKIDFQVDRVPFKAPESTQPNDIPHILVLTEWSRPKTEFPCEWERFAPKDLNADNLDSFIKDSFEDERSLRLRGVRHPIETEPAIRAEFPFRSIEDFDPEELIQQVECLSAIYRERQHLINLAAFASRHATRSKTLSAILSKPDGAKALAFRVEAWESISSAPADAPIALEDLRQPIDGWNCFEALQPLQEALLVANTWTQRRPDLAARDGVSGIISLIDHIDQLLSNSLQSVISDPEFRLVEAQWRAIQWLVRSADTNQCKIKIFPSNRSSSMRLSQWRSDLPLHSHGVRDSLLSFLAAPFSAMSWIAERGAQLILASDRNLRTNPRGALIIKSLLEKYEASKRPIFICGFGPSRRQVINRTKLTKSLQILTESEVGENIVLVAAQLLLRPSHGKTDVRLPKFSLRWQQSTNRDEDLHVDAVYPVALVLAKLMVSHQSGTIPFERFRSMVQENGLMCRRLNRAILIEESQ